ncbi:hypothetical protein CANARDRAFT_6980 [[Candida] arabinofermentans NRRL YB-2248]|uniref:AB hydrolase-1 domain-containing protein n=1 Tax=[Candida] arabinofermentans NRRL YB-2248 TaxID=983967 RepID=A0A1E4T453_9ASCO|nr:hypothetical protein CANARDRAFT_6980 [[Candida] arabinofermentans NRRL YB-2248]
MIQFEQGQLDQLKKLQEQTDDESQLGQFNLLKRFYTNDLYSDFEKEVLNLIPNDCPIVAKYSKLETFPIVNHTRFDSITLNVLNIPAKSSQPTSTVTSSTPVLLFVHGLGGQLSQFELLIEAFKGMFDIFGVDLPGFGNSKPVVDNNNFNKLSNYSDDDLNKLQESLDKLTWEDYQTDCIVDVLYQILEYKFQGTRSFIIIGHSMGTHISLKLINKFKKKDDEDKVESLILLAPAKLGPLKLPLGTRMFLNTCNYTPRLFDFYRLLDRKGGIYSKSVNSYIYSNDNDDDLMKRFTQLRWNLDTNSTIFLRYVYGFKPITSKELIESCNKISNCETKSKIMIVCGNDDKITPLKYSQVIYNELKQNEIKVKLECINNANHSLFIDNPNDLKQIIFEFLQV